VHPHAKVERDHHGKKAAWWGKLHLGKKQINNLEEK
tara:strand:- start:121723 stop:121830 length:108 start_codon:yes stop_codon:yes gene_type:complete